MVLCNAKLGLVENFWFGHQGYEYVELGRLWQILLLTGLVLWLFLMIRALIPALKRKDETAICPTLFVIASLVIAFFYAAGLMYGRQTHMAVAEYWRWWVVHLWVEGFFEVFATVVASFLFCRLGLLGLRVPQFLCCSQLLFSLQVVFWEHSITCISVQPQQLY